MREYLQAQSVEFDDRNIRQSNEAQTELLNLTNELVVPLVLFGDLRVAGFDPIGLDRIIEAYRKQTAR